MPDVRTEGVAQSLMIGDWKMFVCRDKRHLGHGVRGFPGPSGTTLGING